MERIFSNTSGTIDYESSTGFIYANPSSVINVDAWMEALKFIMETSIKRKYCGLISDMSKLKGTFTMMNDFIMSEFVPTLQKNGIQFNVIVVLNDIFTQFATNQLMQKVNDFEIVTVNSLEKAKAWAIERLEK